MTMTFGDDLIVSKMFGPVFWRLSTSNESPASCFDNELIFVSTLHTLESRLTITFSASPAAFDSVHAAAYSEEKAVADVYAFEPPS